MRLIICQLLAVSVLFMSVEGVWDMAKESHAHRDHVAHQSGADDSSPDDPDPFSDGDNNKCGHMCHGHMSSITGDCEALLIDIPDNYFAFSSFTYSNRSQAPPTPPPNA